MQGFNPDPLVDDPAVRRLFADLWKGSPSAKEAGAWLIVITVPAPAWYLKKWPPGEDLEVSASRCLQGAKAMVHTHPVDFTKKYPLQGAKPSTWGGNTGKGDWGAAIRCGIPNYVPSVGAVWKVLPNADSPVMEQVAGSGWDR